LPLWIYRDPELLLIDEPLSTFIGPLEASGRDMLPTVDFTAPNNVKSPLSELAVVSGPVFNPDEINTEPPVEPDPPSINIAPTLLLPLPDPVDKEMSPVEPLSSVIPVTITIDPDAFADDPDDR